MGGSWKPVDDAAVKRAHAAGNTVTEMARRLGFDRRMVKKSLERQSLVPNESVELKVPRRKSFRKVAEGVRHGR